MQINPSVDELLRNPEQHVGKKVVVHGRIQTAINGTCLVGSRDNISVKLNLTSKELRNADKEGWMIVGGYNLYNYDAIVEGTLLKVDGEFTVSEIKKISLLDSGDVNELVFPT